MCSSPRLVLLHSTLRSKSEPGGSRKRRTNLESIIGHLVSKPVCVIFQWPSSVILWFIIFKDFFDAYTDISANVSDVKLQSLLETLPGMGAVRVERTGICHSYTWTVDWLQTGGDRPDLRVTASNLQVSKSLLEGLSKIFNGI